jgi:hypothetical protein
LGKATGTARFTFLTAVRLAVGFFTLVALALLELVFTTVRFVAALSGFFVTTFFAGIGLLFGFAILAAVAFGRFAAAVFFALDEEPMAFWAAFERACALLGLALFATAVSMRHKFLNIESCCHVFVPNT